MSRQSLVRKENVFREHMEHNSETVAVLSIIHLLYRTFPIVGAPACIPSTLPACFLFLQVPQPLPAPSPRLSPSWSECLVTLQTKHHQPPADSHQHLLYWVIFFLHCPTSLSIPQPSSYILANPCPRRPTRCYAAPSVILSIPDCSTFPSCQNVLLSSTSSPKSL